VTPPNRARAKSPLGAKNNEPTAEPRRPRHHAPGRADAGPREVPGETWGGSAPFVEHAIALGPKAGGMSWIVPA
jgi:hypothetical protein